MADEKNITAKLAVRFEPDTVTPDAAFAPGANRDDAGTYHVGVEIDGAFFPLRTIKGGLVHGAVERAKQDKGSGSTSQG